MGQRMSASAPDKRSTWFLNLPEISAKVYLDYIIPMMRWQWRVTQHGAEVAYGLRDGEQAAANSATEWLTARAELTLKLAGRRAA
jgi:hypothetical protein